MEVNRGAGKHPHPERHQHVQGHVEQLEDQPGQRGQSSCLHRGHGRHLLHDEECGVTQDEGVSRDVVAPPVEAGAPAGHFGGELRVHHLHGGGLKTGAGHVLDVEEGLGAHVPDGRRHRQGQEAPAQEGGAPAEGGVGEEDEGRQQEQRPAPRHFDKIPAGTNQTLVLGSTSKLPTQTSYYNTL